MMMFSKRDSSLVALTMAAIFNSAAAGCQLSSTGGGSVETDETRCVPQGEGSWTFGMSLSAVDVPAPNSFGISQGYDGNTAFYIFDNTCTIQGTYSSCSDGTPYTIEEEFLADVLTITSIDTGLGVGYFSFDYGNGQSSIGNDGCTCQDDSSGLQGAEGCKCAFPQNGVV